MVSSPLLQQGTPQSSLCSFAFSQFPPTMLLSWHLFCILYLPPHPWPRHYFLVLPPSSFRSLPLASFLPRCCGRYYAWIQPLLLSKNQWGTCLVVQWLRRCTPKTGGSGSIPGQGTRSQMLQVWVLMLQLKISDATAKTQCSQISKYRHIFKNNNK